MADPARTRPHFPTQPPLMVCPTALGPRDTPKPPGPPPQGATVCMNVTQKPLPSVSAERLVGFPCLMGRTHFLGVTAATGTRLRGTKQTRRRAGRGPWPEGPAQDKRQDKGGQATRPHGRRTRSTWMDAARGWGGEQAGTQTGGLQPQGQCGTHRVQTVAQRTGECDSLGDMSLWRGTRGRGCRQQSYSRR